LVKAFDEWLAFHEHGSLTPSLINNTVSECYHSYKFAIVGKLPDVTTNQILTPH